MTWLQLVTSTGAEGKGFMVLLRSFLEARSHLFFSYGFIPVCLNTLWST